LLVTLFHKHSNNVLLQAATRFVLNQYFKHHNKTLKIQQPIFTICETCHMKKPTINVRQ